LCYENRIGQCCTHTLIRKSTEQTDARRGQSQNPSGRVEQNEQVSSHRSIPLHLRRTKKLKKKKKGDRETQRFPYEIQRRRDSGAGPATLISTGVSLITATG